MKPWQGPDLMMASGDVTTLLLSAQLKGSTSSAASEPASPPVEHPPSDAVPASAPPTATRACETNRSPVSGDCCCALLQLSFESAAELGCDTRMTPCKRFVHHDVLSQPQGPEEAAAPPGSCSGTIGEEEEGRLLPLRVLLLLLRGLDRRRGILSRE